MPCFVIAGYMLQILGSWAPPPILVQPRKGPSGIRLKLVLSQSEALRQISSRMTICYPMKRHSVGSIIYNLIFKSFLSNIFLNLVLAKLWLINIRFAVEHKHLLFSRSIIMH